MSGLFSTDSSTVGSERIFIDELCSVIEFAFIYTGRTV
jgi:hypothetical protein